MQALKIGASGMIAQQRKTAVVANNLANMNTTGFHRRRTELQDLIYDQIKRPDNKHSKVGNDVPNGVQSGFGVQLVENYRIAEQGSLRETGNAFDIAIQGSGYFQVQLPDGTAGYTRDGTFQLDSSGALVTTEGYLVQPSISIPANAVDIVINANGEIQAKMDGQAGLSTVGQLTTVTFPNEAGLKPEGLNLFTEAPASGAPTSGIPGQGGFGVTLQGMVESSNVNPVEELAAMIAAQRAYELNSKVIQTADQMMAPLNG